MIRRMAAGAAFAATLAIAATPAGPSGSNLTIGKLLETDRAAVGDRAVAGQGDQARRRTMPTSRRPRPASRSRPRTSAPTSRAIPQAALSAARTLVDQGASCLIGPSITPESIAIANGLTIQKQVTIWPTGTSMRLRTIKDEGTIFRTVPPDSLQALALVAASPTSSAPPSGKLVSVVYRNEPYGEGLAKDFAAAWQAKGGKVQGPVVFDPDQATFDSEAGQIVANNPDAYRHHRLPRHLRQAGRRAGAHRQVRRDQGCSSPTRSPSRRCRATSRRRPSKGCAARAAARRPAPTPTSCSTSYGRRPAGSSISRSTPTASIRRPSASSRRRRPSRRSRRDHRPYPRGRHRRARRNSR